MTRNTFATRPLWLLGLALLALSPAAEAYDKVLLKDGRLIEGKLLESDDSDYVRLRLSGVDIPIRAELVDKTFVEDLEDYKPKDKKEEQYLAKGWVLFEGRWMSRTRRETELKKRKAAQKEAIDKAKRDQNWRNAKVLETTHFVITSNCTEEVLDDYATRIEDYYKNFLDHWNIKVAPSLRRTKQKFFLYRNYEDFLKVTKKRPGVLGFFNIVDGELHLFHKDNEPEYTIAVMYHEGNHLLTYLIAPQFKYPMWMNEGMAEYYGSARVADNGDFIVGELQYGRIATLRTDLDKGDTIPLEEVLLAENRAYTGRHYAYGWSFVHFLMQSKEYSKAFRAFFAKLESNKDIEKNNTSWGAVVLSLPDPMSVMRALEKRLGKSVEELEVEWMEFREQAYGELTGPAYYRAAQLARGFGEPTEETLSNAFDYYEKAVGLNVRIPACYREYAEMLRKGGINEGSGSLVIREPAPERAWEMIQQAIDLDPIDPLNYTEASGILIMDSDVQDLDMALAMTETALALGPRDWNVKNLVDELVALIEPARERAREREENAKRMAEMDERVWIVQPAYIDGEEVPETMDELSTADVKELIAAGAVTGADWLFQTFRYADPETGELAEPSEKWDKEWVMVKDVPDFAEDLEAAPAEES